MGRKVFISVLGASMYRECVYTRGEYKSNKVRFIQEATLQYLNNIEKWTSNDMIHILLTKEAKERNWTDKEVLDENTQKNNLIEGLETRLVNLNLGASINPIMDIPHGNTEDEIWYIFEQVFQKINEGDELYFDLTHGFRYLPMLVMVLINYSKVLKNIKVKSITYGNFESKNEFNEAPIIDLLSLSELQDWTNAAAQYLEGGSVNRLKELGNKKISPILSKSKGEDQGAKDLNNFLKSLDSSISDMQTCRGINIVENKNIKTLNNIIQKLDSTFITPLNPIFEKVKESFNEFSDDENIKNGFVAAKWCVNYGMYQQAITILQENIVTMICAQSELDYKNRDQRKIVNTAFNVYKKIPEDEWKCDSEVEKEKVRDVMTLNKFDDFVKIFSDCTSIRNDINHSGMRPNAQGSTRIIKNIEALIDKVFEKL